MTAPNLDQQEEIPQEETLAPSAPQPPAQQTTRTDDGIDYRQLYIDSVRRQNLAAPAPVQQAPSYQPEVIADDELEPKTRIGIEKVMRNLLNEQLGDVRGMSLQYKRDQAIAQAESQFFLMNPEMLMYREQLSPLVRARMASFSQIDVSTYEIALDAEIGRFARTQARVAPPQRTPEPPAPPAAPQTPPTPPVPGQRPAQSGGLRSRLTESEKNAMRRLSKPLDPNKEEDVAEWFRLNSDEGYVAR